MKDTLIVPRYAAAPDMLPIATGKSLKIFEVSGSEGMCMPKHYSTEEAVVTIKSGKSLLTFENKEVALSVGDSYLIPAGKWHTLTILKDFKALVVMPVDSSIEFIKED